MEGMVTFDAASGASALPGKRKESERELRPDSAKERERFTVPAVASRFGRIKEKSLNANCVQTQSGGCGSWI